MKLRFTADRKTLLWAFVLFPAAATLVYANPRYAPWFIPLSLYTGFCSGVLAHYHNHCPVFASRRTNALYAIWISIFYGYPIFAWIPTHNANHHKYVNGPGDATITWRYGTKDSWWRASTFFFFSSYWQGSLIRDFVAKARRTNVRQYHQILQQYLAVLGAHLAFFALAVRLHGLRLGALTYACSFGATAAMGLWGMMFINYIQHVHCDPWSPYDHSRNFTGRLANWMVFNSGYHTAHHEKPGAHWSTLPQVHDTLAHRIHPELNQPSIFGYIFKAYVLGRIASRYLPHQIGRPAYGPAPTMREEEAPSVAA